jgi:hypothetical protein
MLEFRLTAGKGRDVVFVQQARTRAEQNEEILIGNIHPTDVTVRGIDTMVFSPSGQILDLDYGVLSLEVLQTLVNKMEELKKNSR